MTKPKPIISARARREAELGQFELPSIAAGLAVTDLMTALKLLDARQMRHGTDPYLDRMRERMASAMAHAVKWQTMAARMLEYPYAREEDA